MNKKLCSLIVLSVLSGLTVCFAAEDDQTEVAALPVKYNTDAYVDLGVGLWAFPIPVDYDRDGRKDLVVSCPDTPYHGTYFFRNIGTAKSPLFDRAVKISDYSSHHLFCAEYEEETLVTDNGIIYDDFISNKFKNAGNVVFEGEEFRVDEKRFRNIQWAPCDWEADGDMDYVVGFDSWSDYGWDNAFDKEGKWTNGPLHGNIYLIENIQGKYVNKGRIRTADGRDIDVYGTVSPCLADFDRDGDLDLICGEFLDGFTYFENTGTRQEPVFANGRALLSSKGPVKMHLEMIQPRATDWDGDGWTDLVVGDEDGRVALVRNTGKVKNGSPLFQSPVYFRQKADDVKFGALSTPCSFDWDGDGEEDIIAGNSSGEIAFIKNLGGGKKWAEPRVLEVCGCPLRIMAGENGSIQGPAERKWGYTVLSVADWDGDGKADIIVNSIIGKIQWFKGLGGLRLAPAKDVAVAWDGPAPRVKWNWWTPEDGTLVTQWRTTPVATDWNKDGRCDLIVMDQEGYLSYFERREDGLLNPGRRIFFCNNGRQFANGQGMIDDNPGILRLNKNEAGGSGRRKICFVDWDGDGLLDLVVDSKAACWFKGLGPIDDKYEFSYMGEMSSTILEGHTTCPTSVNWSHSGVCDILVGAEDGRFYLIRNSRSQTPNALSRN